MGVMAKLNNRSLGKAIHYPRAKDILELNIKQEMETRGSDGMSAFLSEIMSLDDIDNHVAKMQTPVPQPVPERVPSPKHAFSPQPRTETEVAPPSPRSPQVTEEPALEKDDAFPDATLVDYPSGEDLL